jgi:hypothetical protein
MRIALFAALAAVTTLSTMSCGGTSTGSDAGTGGSTGSGGGTGTGGGAATQTMFDKYKAAGFTAVNNSIITKAAAAPTTSVGSSFANLTPAKVETLRTNLGAFLIQAYGGPKNYAGKNMKDAHTGLAITEAQYDYFITEVVVKALSDNGVTTDDITKGFAPAVTDKSAGSVKCDTVQSGTKPTGCP